MTRPMKLMMASFLLLLVSASVAVAELKSEWYDFSGDSVVYVYDPEIVTGPMIPGEEPLLAEHEDWNEFGIYMDYVKSVTIGETIIKIVKE